MKFKGCVNIENNIFRHRNISEVLNPFITKTYKYIKSKQINFFKFPHRYLTIELTMHRTSSQESQI